MTKYLFRQKMSHVSSVLRQKMSAQAETCPKLMTMLPYLFLLNTFLHINPFVD